MTNFQNFIKVNLQKNSKTPSTDWCENKRNKLKNIATTREHGILTGKINNLTGFDVDSYKWKEDHIFYSQILKGRSWADYIKEIDTLTVETTSGGHHLYFKYDERLPNIIDDVLDIDIFSDGKYLVGPGSQVYNKKLELKTYEIINDVEPKPMPEELFNFLYKNLKYKHNRPFNMIADKKSKQVQLNEDLKKDHYTYFFNDDQLISLLDSLDESHILKYEKWLKVASAFKSINRSELFLKYCLDHPKTRCKMVSDQYYIKNVTLMNSIKDSETTRNINVLNDYIKCKPLYNGEFRKEVKYIHAEKLGYKLTIEPNKNYVIKSDTGTGKTTIFKNYIKSTYDETKGECNEFLSIVSRISLCDEQYNVFNQVKEINRCKNYRLSPEINTGDILIITIDSICKLTKIKDFSNYIIFLDEYNSLIEYLITCPNLNKLRVTVFLLLIKILKECKQFIACDADITPTTLLLLDYVGKDYEFIHNTFKHNSGILANEIYKFDDFTRKLNNENKALVCCDSAIESITIFNNYVNSKVNDGYSISFEENKDHQYIKILSHDSKDSIKCGCFTADYYGEITLDNHDFIIFSPKIVYGLDSLIKRPVYAHFKEHTINPKAMLQQICRNRNITELSYIFYKKQFIREKYNNMTDVENETEYLETIAVMKMIYSEEIGNLYKKMYNRIIYNEDAYNTNKRVHFRILLEEKGFIDNSLFKNTNKNNLHELNKETKQLKYDNFDQDRADHEQFNKDYLKLPSELINEHKNLFIEQADYNKHMNISFFFFKSSEYWNKKIENNKDFILNSIKFNFSKYKFIKDLMKNLKLSSKTCITCETGLNKEDAGIFYDHYKSLFRDRGKPLNLEDPSECEKLLGKIYKTEFGNDIIKTTRKTINKKKVTKYIINEDILYKTRDLIKYRDHKIKDGPLNFGYAYENSLYEEVEFIADEIQMKNYCLKMTL